MVFSADAICGGWMTDINNQNSKPWYFKLHWQVLFALVAGVAFGWLAPSAAEGIGFVGDLFLRLLKMIIFALLFGLFLTRLNGPKVDAVQRLVDGVLEVIQALTLAIVKLAPVEIFALLAREVARSGPGTIWDLHSDFASNTALNGPSEGSD